MWMHGIPPAGGGYGIHTIFRRFANGLRKQFGHCVNPSTSMGGGEGMVMSNV